jgi:hypothetical protein
MNDLGIPESQFVKTFAQLREQGILTDVVFNVGGTKIPVHKLVLVAGSKYFERLFLGSFRESDATEIDVDVPLKIFTHVVDILYGKYIWTQSAQDEQDLVRALNYFDIRGFNAYECWRKFRVPLKATEFKGYIEFSRELIGNIWGEKEMIRIIAPNVNNAVDLSLMDDTFITTLLLTIDKLGLYFTSIRTYYSIIDNLVEVGHSRDLWNILDYKRLPSTFQTAIRAKYPEQCVSMNGPIPTLNSHPDKGESSYGLMYIDDGYRVVDGNGTIYIIARKFHRLHNVTDSLHMIEGDFIHGKIYNIGKVPDDIDWSYKRATQTWDIVPLNDSIHHGSYYAKAMNDHSMYKNYPVIYVKGR